MIKKCYACGQKLVTIENRKAENMFQFSKRCGSPSDLLGWTEWFEGRGIKTQVIQDSGGFYLYREGIEVTE